MACLVLSPKPTAPHQPSGLLSPTRIWLSTESLDKAFAAIPRSINHCWSYKFNRIPPSLGPFHRLHKYLKQNLQRLFKKSVAIKASFCGKWLCLWLRDLCSLSERRRNTGLCPENSEEFGFGDTKAAKGTFTVPTPTEWLAQWFSAGHDGVVAGKLLLAASG